MKELKKCGRWLTDEGMKKLDATVAFAVFTHNYPVVQPHEIVEFKDGMRREAKHE